MRILDILNGAWAMAGSRVQEIRELYFAHTRREKLDLRAWEAATGRPVGSERDPYQLVDGVAVISISGVITKVDSAWNRICGMTSSQLAQQDLQAALNDRMAHSILLSIDSPGGMVDGTEELANAVFAARQVKPIVALGDGCVCSAAYWIAAAAEKVFITSNTTEVGSIGVVTAHTDISQAEAQRGVKTTEITAGAYKRIASQFGPLSQEGMTYIQGQLDHIYTLFVDSIAKFRGVSVDTVLADMADGRVFLGQQAVEAGLVDGVSTQADLIKQLNEERNSWTPTTAGAQQSNVHPLKPQVTEGTMPITREQLAAEAPDLLNAIKAEGHAEGSEAQLARVKGCLAASLPGHEAMAMELALDGETTPGAAALTINAAENAILAQAKAKSNTGADPLPGSDDALALEAEAANQKLQEQAKPKDAKAMAADITAHIAKAAAEGRTLTAAQAAAELAKGKE